jgi:hypothetical protein
MYKAGQVRYVSSISKRREENDMWHHNVEARTLAEASNHRDYWDRQDLEYVAKHRDTLTDEVMAYALGRSYYAVVSIKQVLDQRLGAEVRVTERHRQETAPAYTFIGNDVPPGWND